jgi:prepilin-type N-terminal cleavage/methylation domain-containing protein
MKKNRQAFSIIELLFVMVIMVALATIAIPKLSSGTDSAISTSLRSDIINTISVINTEYANNNLDMYNILPEDSNQFRDKDNDGLADIGGINNDGYIGNTRLRISGKNILTINAEDKNKFFIYAG